MSHLSQQMNCPSPEATTSAILGASSIGWSPIRTAKRPVASDASAQRESMSGSYAGSDSGSPGKGTPQIPTHRANIAVLRSHGLVSNSVFKSGNPSPTHSQASPQTSSVRQSPFQDRLGSSENRLSVGLGISATSPGKTATRSTSNSSIGSIQSTSDAENEEVPTPRNIFKANSPRKSQGFKKLEKNSYVSNSPFRKPQSEEQEKPLDLPNNAWAVSSSSPGAKASWYANDSPRREKPERVGGVPRTPERTPQRTATAFGSGEPDFGTPTSQGTPRGGRGLSFDSPSNRGLLVSNRLHGPRIMDSNNGTASPQDSPTRRERRKTVTFDEFLDVQEFDRESSFDGHSLQSGSSQASSLNCAESTGYTGSPAEEDMWLHGSANKVVEKLMVVNGTPESASSAFSTPDLDHNLRKSNLLQRENHTSDVIDSSSTDSPEMSSVDEPHSPPPEELSFEHEHADKSYNTAPDVSFFNESIYVDQESDLSGGNLSAYGALHRVDSLVDELLEGDLLGRGFKGEGQHTTQLSDSPPRRRRAGGDKLGEQEKGRPLPTVPNTHLSTQVQLSLPMWSPLMGLGGGDLNLTATPDVTKTPSKKDVEEVEAALQVASPVPPSAVSLPAAKLRAAGRPHISRDAVLQRVAREKKLQEEQQQDAKKALETKDEDGVPQARSHNALAMRRSEGIALSTRSASGTLLSDKIDSSSEAKTPGVPLVSVAPSPTKQIAAVNIESPLERLGAEVAAEQEQATQGNLFQKSEKGLFSSDSTRRQERWFEDDKVINHLQVERPASAASGRTSPSILGDAMLNLTPAQQAEQIIARRRSKNGKSTRPQGRRSLSEGAEGIAAREPALQRVSPAFTDDNNDAELREEELLRNRHMFDASLKTAMDGGFEMGLEREISRIYRQGEQKYKINDRGVFSSGEEKVSHSTQAGDVDSGKAWKKLRRPSDMNEYAKEMRDYRENENPKKVAGKVFVLVDSFTPSSLPVPSKSTRFHCILDNGLHVVKTATASLRSGSVPSKIGQEFELIQHKNLEFSLTLVVQRDSHLQEPRPESPSSTRKMTPSFSRGMGKLFSSPKKKAAFASSSTNASMASSLAGGAQGGEPMLSYINKEGAFGRADVVFEKIAQQCLAKSFTIDLPVRGVNDPAPSLSSSLHKTNSVDFSRNLGKIRGTLRLKLFYLPPMPSVARTLLPQNLGECIKGMEAARWHSGESWMEGTLTQLGGDCVSWRRRPVKAQGAHLIGYNEITKKPTVKIDLSKAIAIEQSHDPLNKTKGAYATDDEELDETYHVERSFRITFKDGEKIYFFADTDVEMNKWLAALRKVVGNKELPANCVWATVALEMIKTARDKSEAAKVNQIAPSSKRVPVKTDETDETPKSQQQAASSNNAIRQQQPAPSPVATLSQRPSKMQIQPALSAVREAATPEQTPTKRRPVSVMPSSQSPRQVSNGRMNAERPHSIYVEGRT